MRTAIGAIIRAFISARACLVAMTVLSLVSALLRYAISVDYKATAAMCFAMGLLSWAREHIIIGMLLCVTDIFEYNIRTAVAISSVTASIAGYTSNIILMAMRKMSLSPI